MKKVLWLFLLLSSLIIGAASYDDPPRCNPRTDPQHCLPPSR